MLAKKHKKTKRLEKIFKEFNTNNIKIDLENPTRFLLKQPSFAKMISDDIYKIILDPASVRWAATIGLPEWGISNISISIPEQDIEISGEYEDKNGWHDFEISVKLSNVSLAESSPLPSRPNQLYPFKISYYKSKWKLSFQY